MLDSLEEQISDFEDLERDLKTLKEMSLDVEGDYGRISGEVEKKRNKSVSGKTKLKYLKK